jgi:hypothetical protein
VEIFPKTRWSLVIRAAGSDPDDAREALDHLCRAYWEPLYRFARRSGADADAARDEVQGFLAELIERRTLAAAEQHTTAQSMSPSRPPPSTNGSSNGSTPGWRETPTTCISP